MTTATSSEFHAFIAPAERAPTLWTGKGILARIADAYHAARVRRLDAQIAQLIETHGGRMTDEVERRISRDLL